MGISDLGQPLFNAWLDGPFKIEGLNKAAHWAAITAGAALSAATKASTLSNNIFLNPQGNNVGFYKLINEGLKILSDPNIEGIPIKAESQNVVRDVDVTEQMIIAQDETGEGSKQWTTDNAAPKPRVWRVDGYLESLYNTVDYFLLVKPTLALQASILDAAAKSRRPVWFKPHYSSFYRVLVERFEYDFDPKSQNTIAVSLTLREFFPYMIRGKASGAKIAEQVTSSMEIPGSF